LKQTPHNILEPLPQESLSLLRRQWILDKKNEQELNQFVITFSSDFSGSNSRRITAMKPPVPAEVALFIQRLYA